MEASDVEDEGFAVIRPVGRTGDGGDAGYDDAEVSCTLGLKGDLERALEAGDEATVRPFLTFGVLIEDDTDVLRLMVALLLTFAFGRGEVPSEPYVGFVGDLEGEVGREGGCRERTAFTSTFAVTCSGALAKIPE